MGICLIFKEKFNVSMGYIKRVQKVMVHDISESFLHAIGFFKFLIVFTDGFFSVFAFSDIYDYSLEMSYISRTIAFDCCSVIDPVDRSVFCNDAILLLEPVFTTPRMVIHLFGHSFKILRMNNRCIKKSAGQEILCVVSELYNVI